MRTLWQDIRYGVRMLAKAPGFTLVAVLALALGIGANSATFSAVNAFLLRPLPVEDPDQLVVPFESDRDGRDFNEISYPDYVDYRDQNEVFSGLVGHFMIGAAVGSSEGKIQNDLLWGEVVTGNYFDALGVRAVQGRTFLPEEDRTPGTHPVVVISHSLWQRRFAADREIVGKTIMLNGTTFTVVGVAPQKFLGTKFPLAMDFWVPIQMQREIMSGDDLLGNRGANWFDMIGRLKPGVSLEQAEANMTAIARRLTASYPRIRTEHERERVVVISELEGRIDSREVMQTIRLGGGLAMVVVGAVLLIACVNVANLLLARATARRREIAIRLAMGATRWRIIRQLLTESLLLSSLGGALGLVVAFWTADLLLAFTPSFFSYNIALDFSPDQRVLGWTLVVSILTGVVFGLAPALQASRPDVVPVLKGETLTVAGGRTGWRGWNLRSLLIVAQIALSLMVLVCSGLFVKSLQQTLKVDPGFQTENLLSMQLDLNLLGYTKEAGKRFSTEVTRRIESLPEVRSAAIASRLPLGDGWSSTGPVIVEGQAPPAPGSGVNVDVTIVGLKFFETMQIPLLQGHDFTERDGEGAPQVVIVNETFARRFFPGENPIGKRFRTGVEMSLPLREIVGVVKDGKYRTLGENPLSYMILPQLQNYRPEMTLVVSARGHVTNIAERVRGEVNRLDARIPLYNIKARNEHLDFALWGPRTAATLASVFGLLALLLAAMGIFGVMSYTVAQRTREIGIRMALGAQRRDVLRLVAQQSLTLTLIGVCLGLVAAFAATRVLAGLLYGVSATDPMTFIGVALMLALVALVACYIPARRAAKVDPMVALRYE
ncbi:MAG: ABC transporter permease [Pyrinomonadaceae bacterium]|nr:ABC transporter permease [Pyrinomonadaceae bacterium]